MKKKLLNPRGYLSWTQVDLWMRNPETYKRRYFLGEEQMENEAMALGKRASVALENGGDDTDASMEALVALLPHYELREHEIKAPLKTPKGEVQLLGKLDTFGRAPTRFREYKTGRVPWTQTRANKHRQLQHYAALIWLFHGKLPSEVWLDWAETAYGPNGTLYLTGNIRSFPVKLGTKEVLEYLALASRVAQEIDVAYRKALGL